MTTDTPNTIRNRLFEVCDLFETIEIALFSSFNFNGDFFEENVLPALFGIDEDVSRAVRSREVHKALAKTSVGVLYDPSVAKPSGKPYRYTHYPVFLEGSLFHAKNIFLIGTDIEGVRWIYLATLSGNLSLSGWGSNCEVMADTWIHSSSEQPWLEVNDYLHWLQKYLGVNKKNNPLSEAISLMSDRIYERRTLVDPEDCHWKNKKHVRLYFSPLHDSFWAFACDNIGKISSLEVASPYWGSVKECIESLADQVAISEEFDISLVMGHLPPLMAKTGMGMEEAKGLKEKWNNLKCYLWKNEAGRFHHLKLYRFETDKGMVSAVGSCNFSRPGLFWNLGIKNEGKKAFGNVESMMLDWNDGIEWSTQQAKSSDFDEQSTADDAPTPWPFHVVVFYDWKTGEYAWSLKGNLGGLQACLKLSDFEISIDDTSTEGKKPGKLTSSLYSVKSEQLGEMIGCVIELNLDESTREYSTPLATDLILQSWLQGAVNEPVSELKDEIEDFEESSNNIKGNEILIGDKGTHIFFEFFDFYRATAGFETKLLTCVSDIELLDLLVFRSDSVWALGSAIIKSTQSAAVKYLVLNESIRLMNLKTGSKQKLNPYINQLQGKVDECRAAVKQALAEELNNDLKMDAEELLGWYEQQFRSANV